MRMLKNTILSYPKLFIIKSQKNIRYETIDFNFKPDHYYKVIKVEPTQFKIPKVKYEEQYESRDF